METANLMLLLSEGQNQVGSLTVLLGNGDGSFGAPVITSVGAVGSYPPLSFSVADFNGDHKQDVALIDTSDNVNVFLSNGDGTFAPGVSYFAGGGALSLATGDFNNDGIIDLAVVSSAGLGVLLGKGDGTFQPAVFLNLPVINQVINLVGDFNHDGNLDLLLDVETLLGKGDGTFTAMSGGAPRGAIAADFNGDGNVDLAGGAGVQLFLGKGDGTFQQPVSVIPASQKNGSYSVAVLGAGRFNADGRTDLLVTASSAGVGLNLNNSGFVVLRNVTTPPVPDFLITAKTSTATVTAGQTASYTISVAPSGGYNQSVLLSCAGNPALTTCTISPNPVPMNGTQAATATVTITTTAASHGVVAPFGIDTPAGSYRRGPLALGVLAIVLFVIATVFAWRQDRRLRWAPWVALPVLLVITFALSSCGGGGSSGGSGGGASPGTATGTYNITVSASSGSSSAAHSTTLTLVVQ
jgi:hypothetical protein